MPQAAVSGHLHGGQQPISGATVQLYAVSNGDGLASIPLLSAPAKTDATGSFSINTYTCPAANPLVFLIAIGGNPGLAPGTQNNAAVLMAALGPCQSITSSTYVAMNELTTVASVWSLAPFMSSYKAVGSAPPHAEQLANSFAIANEMVNMSTGDTPGDSLPEGSSAPMLELNTLANMIAACINSPGGQSGDETVCGKLFSLAKSSNGLAPTNTVDALLNVAGQPPVDAASVLQLISPYAVFEPSLTSPPSSWLVAITSPAPMTKTSFELRGLISPATVAQSVFVMAPTVSARATIDYYIDDRLISTESVAPFWIGGQSSGAPRGFSLLSLSPGAHTLRAVARLPDGSLSASTPVRLNVVPSLNSAFSSTLQPFANQFSAQESDIATVLGHVATPRAVLSSGELAARQQVMTMYLNWGIDPSLDYQSDQSPVLANSTPSGWAAPWEAIAKGTPLSMLFSRDASFYQAIPNAWPRVPLPMGYIKSFQLNTSPDGDGIGYGEVTAANNDPAFMIRSQWYTAANTLKIFNFPMPKNWSASLPWQTGGDRHMVFVALASKTFVSSYKTSVDASTTGPDALYASSPTPLGTLGVTGGSNAANFAELPVLIQPGEAINPAKPIPHAVGGPVGRTWAARVFPASARDANVLTSTNTCTGVGYTNTGLVPYGGVIQLDPTLELTKLSLSLPALRILQAMQTYGYYVMDFGCSDLDIYTATSEAELEPYGGLWGNANGIGVQNEIQRVLVANKLYVVAPLIKKQ